MIRMIQSTSAAHAKAYFTEGLSKADYYINDQELQGKIAGKLAERLKIKGDATKEIFFSLCENKDPHTGSQLTPRNKDDRITGYDINFHCPKSVSVLHVLAKDNHILEAFELSVAETMKDIESDSKTRVRKDGQYDNRNTGELVWAEFTHQTARPVGGHLPDPHLHSHCFVFNATWDAVEERVKASQFREIKRDMPYYQARFHKRLADRMEELGYKTMRTDTSFEIEAVPQEVIDNFSKRTDEIGRIAKEKGITSAKALDALGAQTRSGKQKGLSMAELKTAWKAQMRQLSENHSIDSTRVIRHGLQSLKSSIQPKQCIDHSLTHHFERASVMADRRILEVAYKQAVGATDVSLEAITSSFNEDNRILHIKQGSRDFCTTREVLQEEKRMVGMARRGLGAVKPLYSVVPDITLKDEQAAAISHVLTTGDRVSIIRGAAGSGKTTLMKEAVSHISNAGKKVTVLAPTAEASRGVLKEEGFTNAETVAKFLNDKELQGDIKNQVLWVDEAGLLGVKDMNALLQIVEQQNARLILGGDTRQHASVVRGDALRILNVVGGIKTAEVSKIYRQKNLHYRAAVQDLSKGNIRNAFDKLDKMGAIQTIDPLNPNERLAEDYLKTLKKGKSALIISPTHKEGDEVTATIRRKLRKDGMLGKKEIRATKFNNLNLTEAEKNDPRSYKEGNVIQFNQNLKGVQRGSYWEVKKTDDSQVQLANEKGEVIYLPLDQANKFDAYKKSEIELSKGDKVKITKNGFDKEYRRLNNGMSLEVAYVNKKGRIVLQNKNSKTKYTLGKDFGHITHGHCITSHASQGKTVDEVFIAQPSSTFSATDAKQFYVSVSRGVHAAKIYTDDKAALLEHASEIGDRQSAIELVTSSHDHKHYLDMNLKANKQKTVDTPTRQRYYAKNKHSIEKGYEPEL